MGENIGMEIWDWALVRWVSDSVVEEQDVWEKYANSCHIKQEEYADISLIPGPQVPRITLGRFIARLQVYPGNSKARSHLKCSQGNR